jgi:DNA-binding NarL/FixJ family response regulator
MHSPRPSLPEPSAPADRLDRSRAGLVLIVDDVPDNLAVLHDALDAAGYTVLVATDGASALQRAAQAEPDIVLREVSDAATVEATMLAFGLTLRESEVLYWIAKGKTNRDIGDILGSSPATVKKHLERIYEKLGVETRTAAAAVAMQRVRELNPV